MANEKITKLVVSDCAQKVRDAKLAAYTARSDAVEAILDDADDLDIMLILSWELATVLVDLCPEHRQEMLEEFTEMLSTAVAQQGEPEEDRDLIEDDEVTEVDGGTSVH